MTIDADLLIMDTLTQVLNPWSLLKIATKKLEYLYTKMTKREDMVFKPNYFRKARGDQQNLKNLYL